MADLNFSEQDDRLDDDALRAAMELLFYAYRDFTAEPDAILQEYGFGRAHHRVIHFVGRNPGISVADLLGILRITKQSLARVLRQLVAEGFIEQKPGPTDRRQRLMTLTATGEELERRVSESQRRLIDRVYRSAGPDAVDGYVEVLSGMITDEADRTKFRKR